MDGATILAAILGAGPAYSIGYAIWRRFYERPRPLVAPGGQPVALPRVIIKTYLGGRAEAMAGFNADAPKMATYGYKPTAVTWQPGSHGCVPFVAAGLLMLVLVGIIIMIYLAASEPPGTLTVTYERSA